MKKTTIFVAILSIIFLSFVLLMQQPSTSKRLLLPSAAPEENQELRKEWERQMLADPTTGEIPEGISFAERKFAANIPTATNPVGKPLGVWEQRGPYNVGGRTRAFAMDITDENKIFAGGVSGGLWVSYTGGLTWTRSTPMNFHPGVVSIAQDKRPGKTNTWYYLSGEIYGTSASGGSAFYLGDGLFKSTNGGATWTPVTSTSGGNQNSFSTFYQSGWRVITDPVATADVVLMATMGTVYRSSNGGTSWTAVLGGSTAAYSYHVDVAVTTTGIFYATMSSDGPQKGIWRSTDGVNWTNITPANFAPEYNRIVIGINPNNENEVYFLGNTPGTGNYNYYISSEDWNSLWKYTYVSGNGTGAGGTWDDRSLNLPHTGTQFDKFASQGSYDLVVKVQPVTNYVFVGGTNLWRSTDGFATDANTTQIGGYAIGTDLPFFELYPEHHPDQHDIAFLPSNFNVMFSASDGGVRKTLDCNAPSVSWISCNNGYNTTQFYTIMLDHASPGDSTLIGGLQDNGNFFVNDVSPMAPWKMTVNGDGAFGAIADNKAFYYLSIQQGRIVKCAIDGTGNITNFERIDPIDAKKEDYFFINPLVLDPKNNDIMYVAGGKYLFRNDMLSSLPMNGGWDSIATGWTKFPDSVAGTGRISAVSVSKSPSNIVYYGTNNGKIYRINNAHTGAPNATDISIAGVSNGAYTSCLAIDPSDANKVIAVFSNYNIYSIFYTQDGGTTWEKVGGNLEATVNGTGNAPSIRWASILLLPDGTKKYFMGTSVGLYSADSLVLHSAASPGTLWLKETDLGETVVTMIDTRTPDGLVAVATHGSGVWTKNYWTYNVKNENAANFAYNVSVFPNPTSEEANFTLNLPFAAEVEIELLDIKGVLQQKKTYKALAGEHLYSLDIKGLASGVYVYNIRCNQMLKSGKLIVN